MISIIMYFLFNKDLCFTPSSKFQYDLLKLNKSSSELGGVSGNFSHLYEQVKDSWGKSRKTIVIVHVKQPLSSVFKIGSDRPVRPI